MEVTDATLHSSIAAAISQSAAPITANFALFIEPRYAGVSAGTMRISDASREDLAESAAAAIVRLLGELTNLLLNPLVAPGLAHTMHKAVRWFGQASWQDATNILQPPEIRALVPVSSQP